MQHQLAPMGPGPVFEQIDALPSAQHRAAAGDRDGKAGGGERPLDMGRHVVGSLGGVTVEGRIFWHQLGKERFQVAPHVPIGVLLDDQGRRSMAAIDAKQPNGDALGLGPVANRRGDLMQSRPPAGDGDGLLSLLHIRPFLNLSTRQLNTARSHPPRGQGGNRLSPSGLCVYEKGMPEQYANILPLADAGSATAMARGVGRLLADMGYDSLTEFKLKSRRRADVIGLDGAAHFVIVEIKSSLADYRADAKWPEYRPFCDAFYFAVAEGFPVEVLDADCGILIADAYDAAVLRPAPAIPMNGNRRRHQVLSFARTAARRLGALVDPVPSTTATRGW